MEIMNSVLQNTEKIIFALRALYAKRGYQMYRMTKFEEYDLYAQNKDFLVSDNVITFTDTNGKLMALKPDVTLSIIKNSKDLPEETRKLFYSENVYRVTKGADSFKEIMQTGLECFGKITESDIIEVLELASESLQLLPAESYLEISDISLIEKMMDATGISPEEKRSVFKAIGEKNIHEILAVGSQPGVNADALQKLISLSCIHGRIDDVLPELDSLFEKTDSVYKTFRNVLCRLAGGPQKDAIRVDFSVIDDINYYNGIVFKGFLQGIPMAVLSGGQYDRLMQKLQRASKAIGFAVYTDSLERVDLDSPNSKSVEKDEFINIALPKGRLGEKVYAMFAQAGFECPEVLEPGRKLIFVNEEKKLRYFWVKPSDVAIYVERGAADIGVAGKDILLEYEPDIYELLDLNTGKCRMAVAGPEGFVDDPSRTLHVATKFSNIAKQFYRSRGRDIDIIHLNGSIEIAPILGLSDVIVDIVETGTTLRENHLSVLETIFPISARLIANKASFEFKSERIERLKAGIASAMEENK